MSWQGSRGILEVLGNVGNTAGGAREAVGTGGGFWNGNNRQAQQNKTAKQGKQNNGSLVVAAGTCGDYCGCDGWPGGHTTGGWRQLNHRKEATMVAEKQAAAAHPHTKQPGKEKKRSKMKIVLLCVCG